MVNTVLSQFKKYSHHILYLFFIVYLAFSTTIVTNFIMPTCCFDYLFFLQGILKIFTTIFILLLWSLRCVTKLKIKLLFTMVILNIFSNFYETVYMNTKKYQVRILFSICVCGIWDFMQSCWIIMMHFTLKCLVNRLKIPL